MAETATILATDLVDSTATRVSLGEDRAEQLRRDHDSLLAEQAALTGRIDEARGWFDEARRVLIEQESGPLLVAVDHDEAEMELRLGVDGDASRARMLLVRARAGCTHPAMAPWIARIDALEARLAGGSV